MDKKIIIFFIILLGAYLIFRPRYSGYGQNCRCIGYKHDKVDKHNLNIVNPKTLKPMIRGTEIITTVCFGIPYSCKVNTGIEILEPSLNNI